MNLTALAIHNNRTTLTLLVILVLAGIGAFNHLPRAYDPGFVIRVAQVVTYFPGASPSRVEALISSKIEDAVKEIPELDFVKSESRTGVSIVNVNIRESYKKMRPIWDNLRRKIDGIRDELPDGVIGPNVNDEFGDVFGIIITLNGEGYSYAELKKIADDVRDELLRIPDAAKIEIHGAQEERIFIDYDDERLAELAISPYQFSQLLSSRNIVISGGSITLGPERIEIEPSGNFESLEDIKHSIIQVPGSDKLIYLQDIARVYRGYVDPRSSAVHTSGSQALALAISMREGGDNIRLGQQVLAQLQRFKTVYPYGVEFDIVNFAPQEVDAKVSAFVSNLSQAIIVVSLVMLISLGLRTGLVVSALIPTSMLMALLVMSLFSIGLDQISLAALIIALGMLVDNGIVMSENIMVQMQAGKKPIEAAIESAQELRIPLLTASLTTAAAFLPIYLAESSTGEFTASLFKVVTITLLCSWILSLTIIPLLCVLFLKVKQQDISYSTGFYRRYRSILQYLLAHRYLTLLATVLIFVAAMAGIKYLPNIFFPPSDRTYFKMELELPIGSTYEATRAVVEEVEAFMQKELRVNAQRQGGITNWVSYIGYSGPRFVLSHNPKPSSANFAFVVMNTTSAEIIDTLRQRLDKFTFEHFPDLDATIRRIETGPAITYPVEIRVSGKTEARLFKLVAQIKQQLAANPGLRNISDDWGQRSKKLNIIINQERALRAGVTSQDIATSLQAGMSGVELTEYREGEDIIPIVMRSSITDNTDITRLEALTVFSQLSSQPVPLRQVADIQVVWQSARILRRNGYKTVSIGAQLQADYTAAEAIQQLRPWLRQQQQSWPVGYRYEFGGEQETSGKANKSIKDKLMIALFIIVILLVAQFNSIRKPLIILTTIPLGLIGVIVGLLVGQSYFGFMTLLGIISLAGIVINNAIVLLERIQIELDAGAAHIEAIISAAQKRMRPILLTTATTVLGLIPLYLGGGEMWEPMALAIMFGLLFSTILTLGVVPVLYAVLYRVRMH